MNPDGRLRVAQIGAGTLGDEYMGAFVANAQVGEVYLAEPEEERRVALTRRWGIIKRSVADWRELAAEESVDLAHLSGPPAGRVEVARAFLSAGKSVILDAPPAASLEDFDTMARGAHGSAGRLFASLPQLMHPAVRKALQIVKDGDLGELFLGQVTALDKPPAAGQAEPALEAAGFQAVALLQRFLGPATSAMAECVGGEAACTLALRHGKTTLSGITVSQASTGTRALADRRIIGAEGMLLIGDPEDDVPLYGFRGEEVIPIPMALPLYIRPFYVARMLDHLVDCVVSGKEPEVTLTEARAALATALAARESARTGRRVAIP